MTPTVTFNEADHIYTVNGLPVPSVTTVISGVIGNGYEGIPNADYYMGRGRAVHACAAMIAQRIEFDHAPEITGYVAAIRKFFADFRPDVVHVEKAVGSAIYRYAGTLDLAARIGRHNVIIDWKASLDEKRCFFQLGGYSQALMESGGGAFNHGMGVWLRDDGTYKATAVKSLLVERGKFLNLRAAYGIMADIGVLKK